MIMNSLRKRGFVARSSSVNHGTQIAFRRKRLKESLRQRLDESTQKILEILDPAILYFEQQSDDRAGLPVDSSERIFVNGILGTLKGIKSDINRQEDDSQLKVVVTNSADTITSLFSNHQGEFRQYSDVLVDGLRQASNSLSSQTPEEGDDEPMGSDGTPPEADPPPEDEAGPPPEGEGEDTPEDETVDQSSDDRDIKKLLASL